MSIMRIKSATPTQLFGVPSLVDNQEILEIARNAIEKRQTLVNLWNKNTWLFPKITFDENHRAEIQVYPIRVFIIFLISAVLFIPGILLCVLLLKEINNRKILKEEILYQEVVINSIMPIPIEHNEFLKLNMTTWGKQLIQNGIIFDSTTSIKLNS